MFFLYTISLYAQDEPTKMPSVKTEGGFKNIGRYKRYNEIIIGIGAANFLGDIGGADQVGTDFVRDLNISATRPSSQVSFRTKFQDHWAVKSGFYFNTVSGSDSYTKEIYRHNRNISFRTRIVEVSGQVEYFLNKENVTKNYKIKGEESKGFDKEKKLRYVFLGIGLIYFNPKGEYLGNWYALQPMGTEGQGLPGGPKKYSRVTVVIPFGMGVKMAISKKMYFGFEYGARKTYSDYIDDVSNTYYDNNAIREQRGAIAAYFADPKVYLVPSQLDPNKQLLAYGGANQAAAGEQRGNIKNKDFYMFLNVTLSYKLNTYATRKKENSIKFE